MKRIALLIGNSHGLSGVKLDMAHWKDFLMSASGGQWHDDEICVTMNPARTYLLSLIKCLKAGKPDFAMVVFSGHGAYQRNTVLEINEKEELISENELTGIAPRQISVFDCCREMVKEETLSESQEKVRTFPEGGVLPRNVRPCYEKRIMEAKPQQICLYACSIGESAMDTGRGGIYTDSLLRISSSFPDGECYKLAGAAHNAAKFWTRTAAFASYRHTQHPDVAFQPEYIPKEQQLIIGINPDCFK